MSSRPSHAPRHRAEPDRAARTRTGLKAVAVTSGVAAVATGAAIGGGLAGGSLTSNSAAVAGARVQQASAGTELSDAELASRTVAVSRSTGDRRADLTSARAAALTDATGVARTRSEKVDRTDPRELAKALMPELGLSASEFGCLDRIWTQESRWNVHADNPSSSAYGIPQALPGSKMASAGPDWQHNAETQIRWGLGYIKGRYGTACNAWGFKAGHGWY